MNIYYIYIIYIKDNNVNIYFQNQIDFLYLKLIVITMCGLFIACCIYGIIHQTRKTSSLYFVLLKIQLCKLHLKNSILLNVIMNNFCIYV